MPFNGGGEGGAGWRGSLIFIDFNIFFRVINPFDQQDIIFSTVIHLYLLTVYLSSFVAAELLGC